MSSQDADETEEDMYVFVEFDDSVNIDKYRNVHVLGIDSENPIVQLDDTFFLGTYESPLGTHMFFEDDPFAQTNDPLFDKLPEKNLKYINKSRKTIKAEHVYVKAKEENEQEQQQPVDKQNDIKPVTFSSIAEAVEKFKKDWKRSYPDIFNDNKE